LVAHTTAQFGKSFVIRNDHSAFAGGHLFVWIEREARHIPERSRLFSVIRSADCFARVFDNGQTILGSELLDGLHIARQAKHVNRQNSLHFPSSFAIDYTAVRVALAAFLQEFADSGRRNVERSRINVDEHRHRILVKQAVRRSNKAEGGSNDFMPGSDSRGAHTQVQG
jgi:hypothetical protein